MKIGIVNDLSLAVSALERILALAPEHKVIWIARDGHESVELCAKERPDLVLMDVVMPGMNGVKATQQIMANTPCAILLVTASVDKNSALIFEAMGYGALDAVDTPSLGTGDISRAAAPLLAKLKTMEKLIGRKQLRSGHPKESHRAQENSQKLVAIGASAGGPAALSTVLSGLPADFPAAIIIVQHIDAQFMSHMAKWLERQCVLPVRLAAEDDSPRAGEVLLAGTGEHLVFKSAERLGYVLEPSQHIYQPSIDVFFHSICKRWLGTVAGVLLTGMGHDGAQGLRMLRRKGNYTIAQDKASSAVYGMPKAAVAFDAAVDVLPLERIAPRLVEYFLKAI
jgi:two-component system, chemotaxis family, response regulator WspF